jgi:hypothetical protein
VHFEEVEGVGREKGGKGGSEEGERKVKKMERDEKEKMDREREKGTIEG